VSDSAQYLLFSKLSVCLSPRRDYCREGRAKRTFTPERAGSPDLESEWVMRRSQEGEEAVIWYRSEKRGSIGLLGILDTSPQLELRNAEWRVTFERAGS